MSETLSITADQADRLVDEVTFERPERLLELQRERLLEIVAYARQHSPYFKEKYRDVPETPSLEDLPVTLRGELVKHFDDWVTDRAVKEDEVREFVSNFDNLIRPFLDRYVVMTTSGTTDAPLMMLRDKRHFAVNKALMTRRYLPGPFYKDLATLMAAGPPRIATIFSNAGFHSAYLSYLRMKERYKAAGKEEEIILLPIDTPLEEMVRRLNEFQPELIACYPSALVAMVPLRQEGVLNIHPKAIATSAEQLSEANRQLLVKTFGCPVLNNYCSTEGGEVAMSCPEGNIHVNIDWLILEPVDAENRPVPPGTLSDGVLLTNLANLIQPVIRYRLSDKVIWHDEPCSCGLHTPFIELEGRAEDALTFESKGRRATILAPVMLIASIDVEGCYTAQYVQKAADALEIRWTVKPGFDRTTVGENLKAYMQKVFQGNGIEVRITLSDEPFIRTKAGKLRGICRDF